MVVFKGGNAMSDLYTNLKMLLLSFRFSESKAAKILSMSQSNFNTKLKSGTLRYSEVEQILEALGYEIIWQKRDSHPTLSEPNIGMEGVIKSAEPTEHGRHK